MKNIAHIALAAISLVSLAGCGMPQLAVTTPDAATQAQANAVVVDSQEGGNHSASVNVFTPEAGGYTFQAIVHRWVASDIQQYEVTLSSGGTTISTSTIYLLGGTGTGKIVFNHLKNNKTYDVAVVAKGANGNVNGGVQQVINAQTPATGIILFSGQNDIENTQSISINVKLDDVVFEGTATVGVTTTDAQYLNPTATESAQVTIQARATVGYNMWGWDIAGIAVRNLDMTPILCSDGQMHVPNSFEAYPLDGTMNPATIHAYYANWFDAANGNGNFEWWMYAGRFRQYGVRTVGIRTTYNDGNGVTGKGPQQATTTFVN